MYAWGSNFYGQLGSATSFGTTAPNPTATATGTAQNTRSTAAGGDFALAVKGDGTLWSWGANDYGQLGDGTTAPHLRPRQVGPDRDWVQVSAGQYHALALKADGRVFAWGANDAGQLGNATNNGRLTPNPSPTQVAGTYTQVSAGQFFSLARKDDGTIWTWGNNFYGQLGVAANAGTPAATPTPTQVPGTGWALAATGSTHGLGLRADGTVYSWGSNQFGQLGNATPVSANAANPTPALVAGTYAQISAGQYHSLGLKADGTLWAWGSNQYGQLGTATNNGTATANATPLPVAGTYKQAVAADVHSLALKGDGTLWAWGFNGTGALGIGNNASTPTPTQEATGSTQWASVASSHVAIFSLARTASANNFASTGDNGSGMLGDGTTTATNRFDRPSPLSSLQPLPVELLYFTARRTGPATAALAWATASEKNSRGFTVEKSKDGVAFEALGFVAGAGGSSPHEYAFADASAPALTYYRLAQHDADGGVAHSPIRMVPVTADGPGSGLALVPNPARAQVQVLGLDGPAQLVVLDALGRTVRAAPATALSVAGLPAGLYLVRATAPGRPARTARLAVE